MTKKKDKSKFFSYWEAEGFRSRNSAEGVKALEFPLTTHCNLRCPECALNVPGTVFPEHYGLDYIRHAASRLYGIEHVSVSGGEPTAHPRFRQIVPMLRKWFGCRSLTLVTNGYKVIEYRDVLHHFDDILLSHYHHNQREKEFLDRLNMDSRPPGTTVHLSTARRAKNPNPCRRANFVMYVYGRLYPCCSIPGGWEGIGIPLTFNWRQEVTKIPLPCAHCCFAEEGEDVGLHGEALGQWAEKPSEAVEEDPSSFVRPLWRWPLPRVTTKIYGLDLDSWMRREAEIQIAPPKGASHLIVVLESWAPERLHPITLRFVWDESRETSTFVVRKRGLSTVRMELGHRHAAQPMSTIKVLCDKTFVPRDVDGSHPDRRELGIRVVSLRYRKEPPMEGKNKTHGKPAPCHAHRFSRDTDHRILEQLFPLIKEKTFLRIGQGNRLTTQCLLQHGFLATHVESGVTWRHQELLKTGISSQRPGILAIRGSGEALQFLETMGAPPAEVLLCEFSPKGSAWKEKALDTKGFIAAAKKLGFTRCLAARRDRGGELIPFAPAVLGKGRGGALLFMNDRIYRKSLPGLRKLYLLLLLKRVLPASVRRIIQRVKGRLLPKLPIYHQYGAIPLRIPKRYRETPVPVRQKLPVVSVVTPSWNQGQFLERTIKSVLDQNYPELEYIIQDGGSGDETVQILRDYQDRIKHIESCQDSGQANAINRGFHHATGDIMAWLNSDDLLLPGAISYVVSYFLENPDVDVVYAHRIVINENDEETGRWLLPAHDDKALLWADFVPQETLFWRRRVWEKSGGQLDESFQFAVDWDLLLRFLGVGARFVRLPRFLGAFRVHDQQKSSQDLVSIGRPEMQRLRKRCHGREVSPSEVARKIAWYKFKHKVVDALYSLQILQF